MIGSFYVASFECNPIAYLSWVCVVIYVELNVVIIYDIMLGWKYDLGEWGMNKCDQELLLD